MRREATSVKAVWIAVLCSICLLLASCGSGSRTSLQQRIDEAEEGAVLEIEAGTYSDNLVIAKAITLRGSKGEKPVVLKGRQDGEPAIEVSGDAVVRLERLEIASSNDSGIAVRGNARVEATEVQIRKCKRSGVTARDDAVVILVGSRVEECQRNGLSLAGRASAELTSTHFVSNTSVGISGSTGGAISMTDCVIENSGENGIKAVGDTVITGDRVRVAGNGHGEGQAAEFASVATVMVSQSDCGVWLRDRARLELSFSEVADSGKSGIVAWEQAKIELSDSTVSGNPEVGVLAADDAEVNVQRARIENNSILGILIAGRVNLWLSDSTICGNGAVGVAQYSIRCFSSAAESSQRFTGRILGSGNQIPGPDEANGNGESGCCPEGIRALLEATDDS